MAIPRRSTSQKRFHFYVASAPAIMTKKKMEKKRPENEGKKLKSEANIWVNVLKLEKLYNVEFWIARLFIRAKRRFFRAYFLSDIAVIIWDCVRWVVTKAQLRFIFVSQQTQTAQSVCRANLLHVSIYIHRHVDRKRMGERISFAICRHILFAMCSFNFVPSDKATIFWIKTTNISFAALGTW